MPAPIVSHAEDLLAQALARRGVRVTRQVSVPTPSGARPYLLDFAIVDARVDIEVDGPHHTVPLQREKDAYRDAWLRRHGWRVVRVPSDAVQTDADGTAARIVRMLERDGHTGAQGWVLMTLRRAWWNRPSLLAAAALLEYAAWRLLQHADITAVRYGALALCASAALFALRVPRLDYRVRRGIGYSGRRRRPFGIVSDLAIALFAIAVLLGAMAWLT